MKGLSIVSECRSVFIFPNDVNKPTEKNLPPSRWDESFSYSGRSEANLHKGKKGSGERGVVTIEKINDYKEPTILSS